MPRLLRCTLIAACLLVCQLMPSAQVNLNPLCEDDGLLAWGRFSDGRPVPAPFRSNCAGAVSVGGISNATGDDVNQIAAFSTGRGVALKEVNWGAVNPVMVTYPAVQVLDVKVWVLFKRSNCDFTCIQNKMATFLVWANDRLNVERTGIQLRAFGGGTDWVEDQTAAATTGPIHNLVDFSQSRKDCQLVPTALAGLKKDKALNLYLIRTEEGVPYRGIYCSNALATGFANAFAGSLATNSTLLHELSHNLGLNAHSAAALNVMNDDISDGVFFSEGQIFKMNFSKSSAMNITFHFREMEQRDCDNTQPQKGCADDGTWIWPDP